MLPDPQNTERPFVDQQKKKGYTVFSSKILQQLIRHMKL
jgi:hypothetical protein